MAELDLDALEQAARDAGGGCWFSTGWTVGSRGFEVGDLKSRERICSDATARCAEFIAAANPATILELLARLEAAEKERDALRNEIAFVKEVEFPRKAQAVADAWEGKCKRLEVERDALRAKIAEMEQQEPAGEVVHNGESAGLYDILEQGALLYALPGAQAQPAQKAVAYLDLGVGGYVDVGTDLTDEALAALPKGRHMLGIVGTYGVDGYVPAQPTRSY